MTLSNFTRRFSRWLVAPTALALALAAGGCEEEAAAPAVERTFNQVQRLGNPLVSEVLLAKRNHGVHGSIGPAQDSALISAEMKAFIANVAGRSPAIQDLITAVLLSGTPGNPQRGDMLIVQTDKDPATAGWLTWALAPDGWGGRKLSDDVVDGGLSAIFGPLVEPGHSTPGLESDNVNANDHPFLSTFPYLAAPN